MPTNRSALVTTFASTYSAALAPTVRPTFEPAFDFSNNVAVYSANFFSVFSFCSAVGPADKATVLAAYVSTFQGTDGSAKSSTDQATDFSAYPSAVVATISTSYTSTNIAAKHDTVDATVGRSESSDFAALMFTVHSSIRAAD